MIDTLHVYIIYFKIRIYACDKYFDDSKVWAQIKVQRLIDLKIIYKEANDRFWDFILSSITLYITHALYLLVYEKIVMITETKQILN